MTSAFDSLSSLSLPRGSRPLGRRAWAASLLAGGRAESMRGRVNRRRRRASARPTAWASDPPPPRDGRRRIGRVGGGISLALDLPARPRQHPHAHPPCLLAMAPPPPLPSLAASSLSTPSSHALSSPLPPPPKLTPPHLLPARYDLPSTLAFLRALSPAAKNVALQFPDELLGDSVEVFRAVQAELDRLGRGGRAWVLGDTTYGRSVHTQTRARAQQSPLDSMTRRDRGPTGQVLTETFALVPPPLSFLPLRAPRAAAVSTRSRPCTSAPTSSSTTATPA